MGRHHNEGYSDQDARQDAPRKETADGGAGQETENNHGDGRWNNHADGTARRLDRGGKVRLIARFFHCRDENGSHGYGIGGRGTGYPRKEHGRNDGDRRHSTGQPSHEGIGQIDDPAADTAGFHDDAGEHEQGNRHQVKGIHPAEHFLHHHHQGKIALNENGEQRRPPDGNGDGGICGKEKQQG